MEAHHPQPQHGQKANQAGGLEKIIQILSITRGDVRNMHTLPIKENLRGGHNGKKRITRYYREENSQEVPR